MTDRRLLAILGPGSMVAMSHRHAALTGRTLGSRKSGAFFRALALPMILAAGAALRLYGAVWDAGLWLHPDERQIYFVTNSLGWPETLPQAFSASSPLNPHFFAYGSLPVYLLKVLTLLLAPLSPTLRDPGNLHLVGRPLAALLDVGTLALTCRLARALTAGPDALAGTQGAAAESGPGGRRTEALLAAALLSLAVLPLQASHFYTADVLLTFLAVLCLNLAADLACGKGRGRRVGLGIALGLALSTKLSAAPLLLLIPVAFWLRGSLSSPLPDASLPPSPPHLSSSAAKERKGLREGILILAVAAVTFLLIEPYAAIDLHTFLADTARESQIAWGRLDVPYTRQFAGTLPYLYSIWQTALWGLGLPLGLLGWAGLAAGLVRWLRTGGWSDTLLLAWAGPYLALAGALYARPVRYMLPLVPVLCILAARLATDAYGRASTVARRWLAAGLGLLLLLTCAYALSFVSIYAAPHSWLAASEWIYRHVPAGSSLAVEEWDTPLPLPTDVDGQPRRSEEYSLRTLALYDEPDGAAKWSRLVRDLAASDYLVIASRRLYGSIPRLPERYPVTSRYYALLIQGELGFELEEELTRGPTWLNPRIHPLPGAAPSWLQPDESLVVYDHPRVLVFRNAGRLSPEELLARLGVPRK